MAGEEDLVVHVRLVVRLVVDLVAVVGLYGFFKDDELRVGEEVLVDLCADLGGGVCRGSFFLVLWCWKACLRMSKFCEGARCV